MRVVHTCYASGINSLIKELSACPSVRLISIVTHARQRFREIPRRAVLSSTSR